MRKQSKTETTRLRVMDEDMKTGALTPYMVVEVSNREKTSHMPKLAIDQVRNSLFMSNKYPLRWSPVASFIN